MAGVKSLSVLKEEIRAPSGVRGGIKHCDGRNAEHLVLEVN